MALAFFPAVLCVDSMLGDPRSMLHPVRALGRWYTWVEGATYRDSMASGVLAWTLVVVPAACTAAGGSLLAALWHPWFGWALGVVAVWTAVAARDLAEHAWRVQRPLAAGDLPAARAAVGMIVGRDTDGLSEPEVTRAAIEAVAESVVDAVVAPVFWAAVGLALAGPAGAAGGAWAYRAANTLDSAWGHRDARYSRFGWLSARADDALGLLPARLSASLLTVLGAHPGQALLAWRRDARGHASPNAGRVEAAMAGALGVRLGGDNRYDGELHRGPVFFPEGRLPREGDIARAVRLMGRVAVVGSLLLGLAAWSLR